MATDQLDLLDRFITAIQNPTSSLPRETLLGAITHFLGTLPTEQCRQLIRVIGSRPDLWESRDASAREAVALGVRAGYQRIEREQAEGSRWYTVRWRKSPAVNEWVHALLDEMKAVEDVRKGALLAALLKGISYPPAAQGGESDRCTGAYREVQEETILALAPRLDGGSSTEAVSAYGLLADIVDIVDDGLLGLLDLPKISAWYRWDLFRRMDASLVSDDQMAGGNESQSGIDPMRTARAFGRVIQAMYAQSTDGSREAAQCSLLDCIETFRMSTALAPSAAAFVRQTVLLSFIIVISAYIDSVLAHPPRVSSREAQMDGRIAREALLPLSHFANTIYTGGPVEGYEKVLYGLLDVLVALEGCDGVSSLFAARTGSREGAVRRGHWKGMTAAEQGAEDAWWMAALESVCRDTDGQTIESMRDVMQRRLRDGSHQPSFLAAHSLQIALLHAASDSAARDIRSGGAVPTGGVMSDRCLEDCADYCKLLVEQHVSRAITSDQIISAYPSVIANIARLDSRLVNPALRPLDQLHPGTPKTSPPAAREDDANRPVRLDILIASSPHIPQTEMKAYLDNLAREIDDLSQPADRDQRRRAVFDAILKELPDSARVLGIQWWDEWQARVSGTAVRARL